MKKDKGMLKELKSIRELCKYASSRDIGESLEMLMEKYENKETKYLIERFLGFPGGGITINVDEFANIEITTEEYQVKSTLWISGYSGAADFLLSVLSEAEKIVKYNRTTKE